MLKWLCLVMLAISPAHLQAEGTDQAILYRTDGKVINLGKFGSFALFQQQLFDKISSCGAGDSSTYGNADGKFGKATSRAIVDVQLCYPFGPALAGGPAADGKAVTAGLWEMVLPGGAKPTAAERANALTLVLEATDYDAMQYNFCQSRNPQSGKTFLGGDPYCFSNDRASFITWGPRGATAGHGAEVQRILALAEREQTGTLATAFGSEADTIRRLLSASTNSRMLILCAVWIDPVRRAVVSDGFKHLAKDANVRKAYGQVYDSVDADGYKIARFFRLYDKLQPLIGRKPTEIDLAFFIDRATHGGVPPADASGTLSALQAFLATAGSQSTPAQLRRKLAGLLPVSNQKVDRLGRDMIYIIDDPSVALTTSERKAWKARSGIKASDFGLSDSRFIDAYKAGPSVGISTTLNQENVTAAEKGTCPAEVQNPRKP
jgi:hypothetical protein